MNEFPIFNFKDKKIRTLIIDGKPWWVATDVIDIPEVERTQAHRIDDDKKGLYIIHTPGSP